MSYILQATSGCSGRIERSQTSERLAWMSSFNYLVTLPVPHLNLLSMVGMGQKHEYLIWRKHNNSFFTALDKEGDIFTLSYSNGKLLYKRAQKKNE